MTWLRLLITLFVIACPPQAGSRTMSVAERGEEHTESATAVDIRDLLSHRQVVQPPLPSTARWRAARRVRLIAVLRRRVRRAPQRRQSRRVQRCVLYGNDDDPDPDHLT